MHTHCRNRSVLGCFMNHSTNTTEIRSAQEKCTEKRSRSERSKKGQNLEEKRGSKFGKIEGIIIRSGAM